MSERLKGMPDWHKVFGIVETLALAACATGERIGFVTPTPEGTKTTTTEISPTVETGLGMNINEIPITQESFGGSLLKGEIVDVNPADVATDTLKNKILAEFQESPFNPHSDLLTDPKIYGVDVLGSNLIDQSGNKQPFFFVRPFDKDGKSTTFDITDPSGVTYPAPFLFYTESDGKQFVPGGTGKEELGGRFLPVASYDAGELRYFGLVSSVSGGNINLNLFMTYDSKTGITAYTDPYSRQTTSWQEEPNKPLNDIFFPKLAGLISYRSIPEPVLPTETPKPIETSDTVYELSPEQLAAKKLYGSGFELKTEFQGIPVDLTVVTSNATLAQYKQTRGCFPNQEMQKYGASAEDRMAEMVFWGHYVGYLRDRGLTEANYPFEHYLAALKAGNDMNYQIWGVRLDQSVGEFRVDPLKPLEYVTTNATVDPDGNGRGITLLNQQTGSRRGYTQLENSGLRIVNVIREDYKDYPEFCDFSSMGLTGSLFSLGVPLEFLQGHIPLVSPSWYSTTLARLNEIYCEVGIYNDLHNSTGSCLLVP